MVAKTRMDFMVNSREEVGRERSELLVAGKLLV